MRSGRIPLDIDLYIPIFTGIQSCPPENFISKTITIIAIEGKYPRERKLIYSRRRIVVLILFLNICGHD